MSVHIIGCKVDKDEWNANEDKAIDIKMICDSREVAESWLPLFADGYEIMEYSLADKTHMLDTTGWKFPFFVKINSYLNPGDNMDVHRLDHGSVKNEEWGVNEFRGYFMPTITLAASDAEEAKKLALEMYYRAQEGQSDRMVNIAILLKEGETLMDLESACTNLRFHKEGRLVGLGVLLGSIPLQYLEKVKALPIVKAVELLAGSNYVG